MRLAILAALIILAAACGGSAGPSATPDPVARVQAVPLTLEEMPGGWTDTGPGDDLSSLVSLSPQCDIFDLGVVFPGALATAKSPSFQGLAEQQAQTFAGVYASADAAQAAVSGTHDIVDRCGDEFKDALKAAAEDQLQALGISLGLFGRIDVTLEDHNDPVLGDGSAGYRVMVSVNVLGSGETFTVDYRILRKGDVVATLEYATFGVLNEGEESAIANALVASASGDAPAS